MTDITYIIFSDLDGTLLDHTTYSFRAAHESLEYINQNSIPLILVSSKTRPEIEYYQKELNLLEFPFVVENGSAIYTNPGYFSQVQDHEIVDTLWRYRFGPLFEELKKILEAISEKHKYTIHGFHNASISEIIEMTGLDRNRAEESVNREFSIPLFYDDIAEEILKKEIVSNNLAILYGGRFMHFLGKSNKGDALQFIMQGYRLKYPGINFLSVALGDSPNDFDMLAAADSAVLVKRYDDSYASITQIDDIILSPGIGPVGWNESVLSIIKN